MAPCGELLYIFVSPSFAETKCFWLNLRAVCVCVCVFATRTHTRTHVEVFVGLGLICQKKKKKISYSVCETARESQILKSSFKMQKIDLVESVFWFDSSPKPNKRPTQRSRKGVSVGSMYPTLHIIPSFSIFHNTRVALCIDVYVTHIQRFPSVFPPSIGGKAYIDWRKFKSRVLC